MILADIKTTEDITDEQVVYLAGLAQNLSEQDEFAIRNYADSVITSPDARKALEAHQSEALLRDEMPAAELSSAEVFALAGMQQESIFSDAWSRIKTLFSGLRHKVKRVFCKVVTMLNSDTDLDLKKIIKDVLIALIPALAASTGLMPVALPIVVSLAALLLKYGVSKVCPA